jgi:hypothetical protein
MIAETARTPSESGKKREKVSRGEAEDAEKKKAE